MGDTHITFTIPRDAALPVDTRYRFFGNGSVGADGEYVPYERVGGDGELDMDSPLSAETPYFSDPTTHGGDGIGYDGQGLDALIADGNASGAGAGDGRGYDGLGYDAAAIGWVQFVTPLIVRDGDYEFAIQHLDEAGNAIGELNVIDVAVRTPPRPVTDLTLSLSGGNLVCAWTASRDIEIG